MGQTKNQTSIVQTGPLSYGQRALWFLQQLAPESRAYNVMLAAQVHSQVEAATLQRAFQALTNRHAALRTVFRLSGGKPVQCVQEHQTIEFNILDAASLDWADLKRRAVEESHRPFDLEEGPLLRVSLFTRSSSEHLLLIIMHHIAVDFSSVAILLNELAVLYGAEQAGTAAALPVLNHQYLDYARWQMEMLSGPEGERLWAYWQSQLGGELPVMSLPTDRPRPQAQTFRGATRSFDLSKDLTARLKRLAEAERVNLYALLLSSFQILLCRYTGQEDILVGSPPVGERKPEFQGVVGFFHNPVVLRADLSGNPRFVKFLSQQGHLIRSALEHQDYPFSLLVERLQPTRDLRVSPIFQVMFVLYEAERQAVLPASAGEGQRRVSLGGLELEFLNLDEQVSMLDLTLTIIEEPESLSVSLQYNTDLFDESTIICMADNFRALLERVVADPQQRIRDLPFSHGVEGHHSTASGNLARKEMDFSLFYFASDESGTHQNKYQLLIEGAKFADRHGFAAVWTPERHFHAFGGLFPNPSITSAAIATLTERIQIRAGSVVLPIHDPIRVAEDWAVIDNLSNGRVGISFASGWNARDFVFAPENHSRRREVMVEQVEVVRRLWRGESLAFQGVDGKQVHVTTLPRPIQRELPIWLTAAGNPETFRVAGEMGAGVLTNLLSQNVEMLAEKIALYRAAWREHHHGPGAGHVALMLHTFVGEDGDAVREKVRPALCNYLKSSLDQLLGLIGSAEIKVDPRDLTDQNLDALVAYAFERFYETSGLCGTPKSCLEMIGRLKAVGVDEVACLIDFGIDVESVLSSLHYLKQVMDASNERTHACPADDFASSRQEWPALSQTSTQAPEGREQDSVIREVRSRAETRRALVMRQRPPRPNVRLTEKE
jgi:natural product biosynthesis luciferase-like monooxygenase protein